MGDDGGRRMRVRDIRGRRHRRDLGDVAALAASMAGLGLPQPVVVTPAGWWPADGGRLLGWRASPLPTRRGTTAPGAAVVPGGG